MKKVTSAEVPIGAVFYLRSEERYGLWVKLTEEHACRHRHWAECRKALLLVPEDPLEMRLEVDDYLAMEPEVFQAHAAWQRIRSIQELVEDLSDRRTKKPWEQRKLFVVVREPCGRE